MLCESDSMKFYIYFDVDLRKYYTLRYKQEEEFYTVLYDIIDIEFPEGHIMSKDENGSGAVILPTGEIIPLWEIDFEENSNKLYWEDRKTGKMIFF